MAKIAKRARGAHYGFNGSSLDSEKEKERNCRDSSRRRRRNAITRERKSAIGRHNANSNETNLTSHPQASPSSSAWQQPRCRSTRCLAEDSRQNPGFSVFFRCFGTTATRRGIIFRLNEAARDRQESKMLNKHRRPDVAKYLLNFWSREPNNCLPAAIDFLPLKFHLDHLEKTLTRYLFVCQRKGFASYRR